MALTICSAATCSRPSAAMPMPIPAMMRPKGAPTLRPPKRTSAPTTTSAHPKNAKIPAIVLPCRRSRGCSRRGLPAANYPLPTSCPPLPRRASAGCDPIVQGAFMTLFVLASYTTSPAGSNRPQYRYEDSPCSVFRTNDIALRTVIVSVRSAPTVLSSPGHSFVFKMVEPELPTTTAQ